MADYLLGADYGTGGAKVALIDPTGAQLGYAYEEYPIHTDHPGWSEHDAPRYWDAFCRMVRKVLAVRGVDRAEIRGVAASSALPSVVLVDRDGEVDGASGPDRLAARIGLHREHEFDQCECDVASRPGSACTGIGLRPGSACTRGTSSTSASAMSPVRRARFAGPSCDVQGNVAVARQMQTDRLVGHCRVGLVRGIVGLVRGIVGLVHQAQASAASRTVAPRSGAAPAHAGVAPGIPRRTPAAAPPRLIRRRVAEPASVCRFG